MAVIPQFRVIALLKIKRDGQEQQPKKEEVPA